MPTLSAAFLAGFKQATEAKWAEQPVNSALYGFQFQPGTRWNHGLTDAAIAKYEQALAASFPHDFKAFLRVMNGTDLPTLNVYGSCGEHSRESVGVYSYPRDLEIIRKRCEEAGSYRAEVTTTLADQGFTLADDATLVPIYGIRYIVCTEDLDSTVVVSIQDGEDAIVYAYSLQEYLEHEFLRDSR